MLMLRLLQQLLTLNQTRRAMAGELTSKCLHGADSC
jgi:hypothetical protein